MQQTCQFLKILNSKVNTNNSFALQILFPYKSIQLMINLKSRQRGMQKTTTSRTHLSKTLSQPKIMSRMSTFNVINQQPSPQAVLNIDLSHYSQIPQHNIQQKQASLIKESFIRKNMLLTSMVSKTHNFMMRIDTLRWILNESYRLIEQYIQKTSDDSDKSFRIQIQNIERQFKQLVDKFNEIEESNFESILKTYKYDAQQSQNYVKIKQNQNNINLGNIQKRQSYANTKLQKSKVPVQSLRQSVYTINQQQDPSLQFAKIQIQHLQPLVKSLEPLRAQLENIPKANTQIIQFQHKLKHCEEALTISNEELATLKRQSAKWQTNFLKKQRQCQQLQQKIKKWENKWINYQAYAKKTVGKIKYSLKDFTSLSMTPTTKDDNRLLNIQKPNQISAKDIQVLLQNLNQWEHEIFQLDDMIKFDNSSQQNHNKMSKFADYKLEVQDLHRQKKQILQTLRQRQMKNSIDQIEHKKILQMNSMMEQQLAIKRVKMQLLHAEKQDGYRFMLMQASSIQEIVNLSV